VLQGGTLAHSLVWYEPTHLGNGRVRSRARCGIRGGSYRLFVLMADDGTRVLDADGREPGAFTVDGADRCPRCVARTRDPDRKRYR
jgi:hypothetical protein